MKFNKKMIIGICILVAIIALGAYLYFNFTEYEKKDEIQEIQPEQEISDEQQRQTNIALYFKDKNMETLKVETRKIDVKELLNNPYSLLVQKLIDGPEKDNLEGVIPKETKINKAELQGDTVLLDLSKEFTTIPTEKQSMAVNSIVNTLTELVEVSAVKILIDGVENSAFENNNMDFVQPFIRIN